MLHFERLNDPSILLVTASGPLEQADFAKFAEQIEAKGPSENPPTRLMIRTELFPGWDDFEAFVAHLKFVSEHHRQIERIAIVTDSEFLKIMPQIASLLVHPKLRQFDLEKTDEALAWLESGREWVISTCSAMVESTVKWGTQLRQCQFYRVSQFLLSELPLVLRQSRFWKGWRGAGRPVRIRR